jgi:hypothetical protein
MGPPRRSANERTQAVQRALLCHRGRGVGDGGGIVQSAVRIVVLVVLIAASALFVNGWIGEIEDGGPEL